MATNRSRGLNRAGPEGSPASRLGRPVIPCLPSSPSSSPGQQTLAPALLFSPGQALGTHLLPSSASPSRGHADSSHRSTRMFILPAHFPLEAMEGKSRLWERGMEVGSYRGKRRGAKARWRRETAPWVNRETTAVRPAIARGPCRRACSCPSMYVCVCMSLYARPSDTRPLVVEYHHVNIPVPPRDLHRRRRVGTRAVMYTYTRRCADTDLQQLHIYICTCSHHTPTASQPATVHT